MRCSKRCPHAKGHIGRGIDDNPIEVIIRHKRWRFDITRMQRLREAQFLRRTRLDTIQGQSHCWTAWNNEKIRQLGGSNQRKEWYLMIEIVRERLRCDVITMGIG